MLNYLVKHFHNLQGNYSTRSSSLENLIEIHYLFILRNFQAIIFKFNKN